MGKNAPVNAYQVPADPTAVMGRRIVAWLIDIILATVLVGVVFFSLAQHATAPTSSLASTACERARSLGDDPVLCFNANEDIYATEGGDSWSVILITLAFWIANRALLEGATGASIGKHLLGIRVVKQQDGSICGIGKAFLRTLVGIVDHIFCFLVGLITALATKGHRRLGDMAAGTLVVGKEAVGRPPQVPGLTAMAYASNPPGGGYPPPPSGSWEQPTATSGWGAPVPQTPPDPWTTAPPAPPAPPDPWEPAPPAAPAADPWSNAPAPAPAAPPAPEPTPSTWTPAAPVPEPDPEPAPTRVSEPEMPGVGAPTWDPARNAYIQWDPALAQWMQWDDSAGAWRPIS
jgi:uncharacterized RDD family membrane protein YckC